MFSSSCPSSGVSLGGLAISAFSVSSVISVVEAFVVSVSDVAVVVVVVVIVAAVGVLVVLDKLVFTFSFELLDLLLTEKNDLILGRFCCNN